MPVPFRDGATSEQGFASSQKRPLRRPVKRSVAALPTGSSRQRLNGFIGRTQPRVGLDGSRFVIPRQTFVSRCHWWQFPLSGMWKWGLLGLNSEKWTDLAHPNFSRATSSHATCCSASHLWKRMPEDGFSRCDSHHEMVDFRLRKSLREFA
jgi:hypothetical protein